MSTRVTSNKQQKVIGVAKELLTEKLAEIWQHLSVCVRQHSQQVNLADSTYGIRNKEISDITIWER